MLEIRFSPAPAALPPASSLAGPPSASPGEEAEEGDDEAAPSAAPLVEGFASPSSEVAVPDTGLVLNLSDASLSSIWCNVHATTEDVGFWFEERGKEGRELRWNDHGVLTRAKA